MNLNDTLRKENFWNEMMVRFPKAMILFCNWIDAYKKQVGWEELFNGGAAWRKKHVYGEIARSPKFHEMPYEMQQGIWICFVNNTLHRFFEQPEYDYQFDLAEDIKEVFGEIENLIDEDDLV